MLLDAVMIRQIVSKIFVARRFAVHYEVTLDRKCTLRADLVATNTKPYIIVCEVKSSAADFRSDKKWHKYLDYCDQLYFAMSSRTYARVITEIPKGVGIYVVDNRTLEVKLCGASKKQPVPIDNQLSVLTRCSYRAASEKRSSRKNETNGVKLL
jgi:hypothetical protein